jgi:SPFH domain / Band 7 family
MNGTDLITILNATSYKMAFFGPKGVEDRVYPQGATYFFMPFINDWHVFDTKLQNLEMTFSQIRGDRKSQDDLVFKTTDGNDISLDVIIAYRIDASKAPHILQYSKATPCVCWFPAGQRDEQSIKTVSYTRH